MSGISGTEFPIALSKVSFMFTVMNIVFPMPIMTSQDIMFVKTQPGARKQRTQTLRSVNLVMVLIGQIVFVVF